MVPHLARKYRVVRMNLRGHGDSGVPRPDQPLTLARLTQDVLELLDHLKVDAAHLLGVSGLMVGTAGGASAAAMTAGPAGPDRP